MTIATDLIAAERVRQITEKGWTAEHDAGHATELVYAGASYFEAAEAIRYLPEGEDPAAAAEQMRMQPPLNWPWDAEQWHPSADPVRNLVKAGALIAAAIDSLHTGDASCTVCFGERWASRAVRLPGVRCAQEPVVLTAADFTMQWDATHVFPFTESEDGTIMAYGHPDPGQLAEQISEYDLLCAGERDDACPTAPGAVRQTYAVLTEGGPGDEWVVKWVDDAAAPGAFPVSVVSR